MAGFGLAIRGTTIVVVSKGSFPFHDFLAIAQYTRTKKI